MLDVSLLTEHCCTVRMCTIVEIQKSLTQELASVGKCTDTCTELACILACMVPLTHHLVSLLSAAY